MSTVLAFASALFWGALAVSALVFAHEAGHVLAARACGVRVTELFCGLPCPLQLYRISKRTGTRYGITPLLLGGYSKICGSGAKPGPHAAAVLAVVHRQGSASVRELAEALRISEEDALETGLCLVDWGSLTAVYDEPARKRRAFEPPCAFAAPPRDAEGNTVYDGARFDRAGATEPGAPWRPPADGRVFLARERQRTYLGLGLAGRVLVLTAGIVVNLALGLVLLTGVYAIAGVPSSSNVIGSVQEDGAAAEAGLTAGDAITAIDGTATPTWNSISTALKELGEPDPSVTVQVTYERDGATATVSVELDADDYELGQLYLGIRAIYEHPGLLGALGAALSALGQTAVGLVRLFLPGQAGQALSEASSIVDVFARAAQAAGRGAASYAELVAVLSFSLGLVNLLPVAPLDGGKLLIELVQAARGRELSERAQTAITLAGLGLVAVLFLCTLAGDLL